MTCWVSRALQLHPTSPPLYILASAHELDQYSPSSARSLLQRGLRLNPESIELWTEYLKMELTYIESLRRRWDVLGIDASADAKDRKKGDGETSASPPDEESDESRRQVMQGAIVLAVMASAIKGLFTDTSLPTSFNMNYQPSLRFNCFLPSNPFLQHSLSPQLCGSHFWKHCTHTLPNIYRIAPLPVFYMPLVTYPPILRGNSSSMHLEKRTRRLLKVSEQGKTAVVLQKG